MEANYSHESLTPLNNIINNSKFIRQDLKSICNERVDKKVRDCIKQNMNLASQVLCSS